MTVHSILAALLILSSLYYFYFLFRIREGLDQIQTPLTPSVHRRVTVIIVARNEAGSIEQSLRSVLIQNYPPHLMEIILVDDASTDATVSMARNIAQNDSRLKIIQMAPHDSETGGRKPAAIAEAIKIADGEIIMTTDADCTAGVNWIRSMVAHFDPATVFVAGPVLEQGSSGFVSELSRIEFLGLITTAAGLISAGTPIICNGANIAYLKSSFLQADGYGNSSHFSDDEVLMQRIKKRGLGKILFSAAQESIVQTKSPETLSHFWNQRIRWASKKGHYEDKTVLLKLVALYVFFFVSFLSVIAALFTAWLVPIVATVLILKVFFDAWILFKGAFLFRTTVSITRFLIAEFLHVPYIVFAAATGNFVPLHWKGKPIER